MAWKLDATLWKMADAARTMEEQLICAAVNAELISPTLVSQLTCVKYGVEAERAAIQVSKEINCEEDTPKICSDSLDRLARARHSFKVLRKLLSALKPTMTAHKGAAVEA